MISRAIWPLISVYWGMGTEKYDAAIMSNGSINIFQRYHANKSWNDFHQNNESMVANNHVEHLAWWDWKCAIRTWNCPPAAAFCHSKWQNQAFERGPMKPSLLETLSVFNSWRQGVSKGQQVIFCGLTLHSSFVNNSDDIKRFFGLWIMHLNPKSYSLRRGGGTFLPQQGVAMETILLRGRWRSLAVACLYLQDGLAMIPSLWSHPKIYILFCKTIGVHYTPVSLNQGLTKIHTFVCPMQWNVSMQMKPNVQALLICACHPNALAMQLYFHVWVQ